MAARRIPLSISETTVERDHESLHFGRPSRDRRVVASGESFVRDGVHIVACRNKDRRDADGKILVELDSHAEATAGYSSRASSAP